MHGVLITFDCEATIDELAEPFHQYATALAAQPGLISKTWISTDRGYGGFHIFADRAAADAYLASDLAAGLVATDGFDDFQITHVEILDDLSAMTRSPAVSA